MFKEKVNYQEVYDLYQLCSETKDLHEFCSEYGVNYDKFMNWQRHQLWYAKLGKTVTREKPSTVPVQIVGTGWWGQHLPERYERVRPKPDAKQAYRN